MTTTCFNRIQLSGSPWPDRSLSRWPAPAAGLCTWPLQSAVYSATNSVQLQAGYAASVRVSSALVVPLRLRLVRPFLLPCPAVLGALRSAASLVRCRCALLRLRGTALRALRSRRTSLTNKGSLNARENNDHLETCNTIDCKTYRMRNFCVSTGYSKPNVRVSRARNWCGVDVSLFQPAPPVS